MNSTLRVAYGCVCVCACMCVRARAHAIVCMCVVSRRARKKRQNRQPTEEVEGRKNAENKFTQKKKCRKQTTQDAPHAAQNGGNALRTNEQTADILSTIIAIRRKKQTSKQPTDPVTVP
uniref:Putative secreted protein n=1 Tax=Anopheles darlingi TaxID=43151 RepID=A0A2M4DFM2_ANODA